MARQSAAARKKEEAAVELIARVTYAATRAWNESQGGLVPEWDEVSDGLLQQVRDTLAGSAADQHPAHEHLRLAIVGVLAPELGLGALDSETVKGLHAALEG